MRDWPDELVEKVARRLWVKHAEADPLTDEEWDSIWNLPLLPNRDDLGAQARSVLDMMAACATHAAVLTGEDACRVVAGPEGTKGTPPAEIITASVERVVCGQEANQ